MGATFFLSKGIRKGSKLKKDLATQGLHEIQLGVWAIKRCVIRSLSNSHTSWVLSGSLRYGTHVNLAAVRKIEANLSANKKLLDIATDLGGQFCLIYAKKGTMTVVVDSLGIYPVYKWEPSKSGVGIALSDSQHFLGRHISPFVIGQSIAESISTAEGITAQSSMYRDVRRLPCGSILKITNKCSVESIQPSRVKKKVTNLVDSCPTAPFSTLLYSYLDSWTSKIPGYMDLTGGYDTGLVLKICQNIDADIVARKLTSLGDPEEYIARKRAQNAQIRFEAFLASDEDVLRFHMVPQQGGSNVASEYYSTPDNQRMFTLTGMGGTELCTAMFPTFKDSGIKDAIKDVAQDKFKFSPHLGSHLPNESIYQKHVARALNYCSKEASVTCIDQTGLFWLSLFCRSFHGSVIQCATRVSTIYSPFLEADIADILLNIPKSMKHRNRVYKEIIQRPNSSSVFSEPLILPGSQVGVMSGHVFAAKPAVKLGRWVEVLESAGVLRHGVAQNLTFEEAERCRAVARILGYATICTGVSSLETFGTGI